jgi:cyclic 2,3-diphosphoglycerate synthetase
VFTSNVPAGARLAVGLRPDVVVFDGSGAAIPPVATDRRILVVGPGQQVDAYLNTYRRLISDLVIAVNCDADGAIPVTLRLRPSEPLSGRVAVFTAGGTDVSHLEADIVSVSTNLADRAALARELAVVDADTYLVEVKAAAIDVVAEHALGRGRRIVLASNDVVASGADLDAALLELVPQKVGAQ